MAFERSKTTESGIEFEEEGFNVISFLMTLQFRL
jgi:hypothetical protein